MNRGLADRYEHSSSSTKHFKNRYQLKGCKIRDRAYHIDDEDILIDCKVLEGYLPIMLTTREIGCMLLNKQKSSSRKILKNMGTGGFT
jgi:hypothetical protein